MLIVWKDGVFAADRRAVSPAGIILPEQQRLFLLDQQHGVLAHTGDVQVIEPLLRCSVVRLDDMDLPQGREHDSFVLCDDIMQRAHNGALYSQDPNSPLAIGPAADIALGAMFAGASAIQAVRIWQDRTMYGGGQIEAARYNDDQKAYTYALGV